ncbi:saccharopine dehydrogenase [Lobosporangium transversale]|uniref:Saccharopine dehydrogenase n=1 Tax=Lobosporangium transversale TaxID=64571 RepID=A0A1Y2GLJ6_9FUNG|nr:saccharopine dehydrogenase [Lobosporangium transversale]ORZ14835.1 saccharopine dehydrogenase [Lobosporangium transversale]|eukprot:XP_021880967.1 saccharopine dehydrogenase [Lobosporangium transversale]
MTAREFDIVLYGATGFTGLRTCQYLAQNYKQGVRWAIAGRSIPKLEEARQKLTAIDPALQNMVIIKADASNVESLGAMAARTKVVISTVGPFMKHGEPLVEACVKQKTHYVDSTGESPFVHNIIRKYHKDARDNKTILVPQCGFDSVPSEIGTKMVVDYLRKEYNLTTKSVKLSLVKARGAASGGTLASVCEVIESTNEGLGPTMDQNLLVPEEVASKITPAKVSAPTIFYDHDFQQWQAYFFMSSSNEKIVKRSHGLALEADGVGYGPNFSYSESMSTSGLFAATIATIGVGIGGAALAVGPIRRFVQKRFLPAPGTGPSDEDIAKGHFTIKVIGESDVPADVSGTSAESHAPVKVMAVVQGGEPGYSETCKYLAESALCLVQDEERIRSENRVQGGVLTPAYAFGQVLVDRLRSHDAKLTVSRL